MTHGTLYQWPAAAKFGRPVPKGKFYEHATIPAALKERFVGEVQRITWAYKLADSTIHLAGSDAVPEVQVFVIDAKGADVSDDVLAAIDKAVPYPLVFEITRMGGVVGDDGGVTDPEVREVRMVAANKTIGSAQNRVSAYFSTAWLPAETARAPLPAALDLAGLHGALLTPLMPVAVRRGEAVADAAARLKAVEKVEREIKALERKLRSERQLNRKIELRRQLKGREAALAELTAPVASTAPAMETKE
ncbi:DUF4391 domain-containing protein [Isoptericola jiangsuensis]|uniref:DUF4391 domain-containing protein n=1 Tax=Isoptericola jiangsuensis TaxID=548579 RepID=UPI003AAC7EEE